jgi:hypothetical protein
VGGGDVPPPIVFPTPARRLVTPAKAGVQFSFAPSARLHSGLRRNHFAAIFAQIHRAALSG